jgi:hypothetical protein
MAQAANTSTGVAGPEGTMAPAHRRIWRAGGARRTVLSFVFLLLLPFYASLAPMLFMRIRHGLWFDTVGLMLFGLGFSVLMGLLLVQLVHSIRSRVELGDTAVTFTLPAIRRGPTPLLRFTSAKVPYADIAAVETRSEVYGEALAPTLLRATRLTLKDGTRHVLGYVNEQNTDQAFPYPEIGAAIAARAGLPMTENGMVRRSLQQRLRGGASTAEQNQPLTGADIAAINDRHTRNMRLVIAALALLVTGGIAVDMLSASKTSFADMIGGAGQSPAGKKK